MSHKKIKDINDVKNVFEKVYVNDDEFVSVFIEKEFTYKNTSTKKLIEYILYQIEKNLQNKSDFNIKDPIATIEHIIPQNPENIENKELYKYLNNIANFTLLENKLNRDGKDLDFKNKIEIYKNSNFKLTNQLQKFSEWEMAQIKSRQKTLDKIAKKVWKIDFEK